eukprot:1158639-Pelagomonas_calceolata.AAC.6
MLTEETAAAACSRSIGTMRRLLLEWLEDLELGGAEVLRPCLREEARFFLCVSFDAAARGKGGVTLTKQAYIACCQFQLFFAKRNVTHIEQASVTINASACTPCYQTLCPAHA